MNFVIGGTNEKKLDFLPHLENKSLQKNSQKKAEGGMRKKYPRKMAIESGASELFMQNGQ